MLLIASRRVPGTLELHRRLNEQMRGRLVSSFRWLPMTVQLHTGHLLVDSFAQQIADCKGQRADHETLSRKTRVNQLER